MLVRWARVFDSRTLVRRASAILGDNVRSPLFGCRVAFFGQLSERRDESHVIAEADAGHEYDKRAQTIY